jgi:hypothetical protein
VLQGAELKEMLGEAQAIRLAAPNETIVLDEPALALAFSSTAAPSSPSPSA